MMNGAAFWFGGVEPILPYAEVTQIKTVEINGNMVQKVLWGKKLPANFTNTYKNQCSFSSAWLNPLDFSQFTEIGDNNFSTLLHFMRTDSPLIEILDFTELVSIGQNCFNIDLRYTKMLKFPKLTTIRNCFNKIMDCTRIESPTLKTITGPCFSGINNSYYPKFYIQELETISGSGVFCNLKGKSFTFTFPKLQNVSNGNFQNVQSPSSLFLVNKNITSSSESIIRKAFNGNAGFKFSKEG